MPIYPEVVLESLALYQQFLRTRERIKPLRREIDDIRREVYQRLDDLDIIKEATQGNSPLRSWDLEGIHVEITSFDDLSKADNEIHRIVAAVRGWLATAPFGAAMHPATAAKPTAGQATPRLQVAPPNSVKLTDMISNFGNDELTVGGLKRTRQRASLPPERLGAIGRCPGMPDRTLILDHLAQAQRHVAEAERHVANQREIVAQRERDGHDTATSKRLLDQFEQLYALHVTDRDRLEKALDEASK
jgi:hypothetical protein